jgi:hypothetical protein
MEFEDKLQKYAGYEKLVMQGGLAGEKAQNLLYGLFSDEICEVIKNTGGIDENFWTLAGELQYIEDEYSTPMIFVENEDGTEDAIWEDKSEGSFFQFRMVASAICIRNPKYQRLQNFAAFEVSQQLKKRLMMLTQLEGAILWEYLGLGVSEAGSVEDISRKMDFCSTPAYIRRLMDRIEIYFKGYQEEWTELNEYASHLRKEESE